MLLREEKKEIKENNNVEAIKVASIHSGQDCQTRVKEMVVGAGSSRLTDVIDLRSSIAMSPPEMTLSAATTIGDTAYLSTPVTTEAFDHESGDHTKSPDTYIA